MKPDNDQTNWQQPTPAPSQAPYVTPAAQAQLEQQMTDVNATTSPRQEVNQAVTPVEIAPQPQQAVPVAPVAPAMAPIAPAMQESPEPQVQSQVTSQQPPEEPRVTPEVQDSQNQQLAPSLSESTDETALLRWQGSEYLHHDRNMGWYAVMVVVVLALMALAIFALKSFTFAALVPVMAVALVIYVHRPPDTLNYTLSHKGLHVNDKLYPFDQFKSFGVVQHNGVNSVVLVPRKRFQIGQTLYFPAEIGEQLVDMLAVRLPMKEIKPDIIDKLLARLRI
jgi:hypothetical protein